jgi:hypothetical protein
MQSGRPVQETLPPNATSEQALALFLTNSEAFDADGQEMSGALVRDQGVGGSNPLAPTILCCIVAENPT